MATATEIQAQLSREAYRRGRLGVPALAGGVLYLLGSIIIAGTLKGAPTVGLFQGLEPALRGEANPAQSPRAAEVKFISHHAFDERSRGELWRTCLRCLPSAGNHSGHE